MTGLGSHPPGATPLTDDDLAGLRVSWVSTRSELDGVEAINIFRGRLWAFRRRRSRFWYLEPAQLDLIHTRMFDEVWSWAGTLRRRDTNIGVDPHCISVSVRDLCDDTLAQIGDGTALAYPADELAVRFHHRLVLIHPYPNGNGRHSRLATDLLVRDLGLDSFTWGSSDIGVSHGTARRRYLDALRTADAHHDFVPLLQFARS